MNYYERPAQAQLPHVMPGAGEMVFHEHHPTTIRLLEPWLNSTCASQYGRMRLVLVRPY
jgi:hypothetical protein